MSALVKYDAARYALEEAALIDDVIDIRDKAQAMAAYARQAKDTKMVEWVTEIKVRAERKAGKMLSEMTLRDGGHAKKLTRSLDVTELPPTLSEMGISKNESSRWQKLAAVSDNQFEVAISAAIESAGEVTTAVMLRSAEVAKENKHTPEPCHEDKSEFHEEMPDFMAMCEDQQKEITEYIDQQKVYEKQEKAYKKTIEIYESEDKKCAELLRLNTYIDALNGRLNGITIGKNEAEKMCKRHDELLAKIRKALKVASNKEILPAIAR